MRYTLRSATALLALFALPFLTSAGSASEHPVVRLTRDVTPTFESVRLRLDARKPGYNGSAHVDLHVGKTTSSFRFHAREMKLEKVTLRSKHGVFTPTIALGNDGLVTATVSAPLVPGEYSLDIAFSNEFDTRAAGLYRLETGGESYAFTQFEADDARGAFPCWDEPEFKIPYQITLTVPAGNLAITNTPPRRTTVAKGWKTVVFARTRPLPSYLLAIATGPLETVPIPGMSIPGRVVTVKGASGLAAQAVAMTPPIVRALERYFGGLYPYEKLDLIAVPEFWPGAMENPGAVTFADRVLLLDPKAPSFTQKQRLAHHIAHELAHIWFGDVVTMRWWDDLWLNESFAEWMGNKIAAEAFPEIHAGIARIDAVQAAFDTDARPSTRAIRQPVTVVDLFQMADALAYEKGEAVLGMFEAWMGPETFRRGVLDYIAAHRWGTAVGADLWDALSRASGKDVGVALNSFLDQEGVPLVGAELLSDGRVKLTQRRFRNYGVAATARTLWRIPVALKYPDGDSIRIERVLLADSELVITLPGGRTPAWIHPNAGETGYYRWSVPAPILQALADRAQEVLTTPERVGLIENAGALVQAGALHEDEHMKLIARFNADPAPEVVRSIVAALARLRLTFVTPDLEDPFARYVRATLGPQLERFGRARVPGEEEVVSLVRPELILCLGDAGRDDRVLAYADSLAKRYLADPASIDPALADPVLELYATRADRTRFDELRRRFEETKEPAERALFLDALGWVRKPETVDIALHYALTGPLRPQELLEFREGMRQTPGTLEKLYRWLVANYDAVAAKIPKMYTIILVHFAEGCSSKRLADARPFFTDPARAMPGTDQELAKVADQVTDCVGLNARESGRVTAYLSQLTSTR